MWVCRDTRSKEGLVLVSTYLQFGRIGLEYWGSATATCCSSRSQAIILLIMIMFFFALVLGLKGVFVRLYFLQKAYYACLFDLARNGRQRQSGLGWAGRMTCTWEWSKGLGQFREAHLLKDAELEVLPEEAVPLLITVLRIGSLQTNMNDLVIII